jgi:hypothetical protein
MDEKVNQQGASAGGDVVGRDKIVNTFLPPVNSGVVQKLLEKLEREVQQDTKVQQMMEMLQRFYTRRATGGPIGLEEKLKAGGRDYEIASALEMKELFVKALERWSLYPSAQEIFVQLLARAEVEFSMSVTPLLGCADHATINQIITTRIVEPTVSECGPSLLTLNHLTAMGMVYWLAEQCFVRWHK